MERKFLIIGAISAFIGVAAGAFGAHGLKNAVSAEMLTIFETGVRYQMYHAFALIFTALASTKLPANATLKIGGWLFVGGTILFSGSLYALVLSGIRTFGAITPLGGVAFLGGWICLIYAGLKKN